MRWLVASAAVALVALVASPAGAVASTTTTGPGGCQWQAGIVCPGPWPVAAAVSPLPRTTTGPGVCQWRAGTVCDPIPVSNVTGHFAVRALLAHADR